MFSGKKGLILGVANDRSIAWVIAQEIMDEGGLCGFTHLPDRPDDDKQKNRRRVALCLEGYPQARFLVPLDVQSDEDIAASDGASTKRSSASIDFLLHSIAFADRDDLSRPTVETSRDGFKLAMDISAYSLIAVANAAKDMIRPAFGDRHDDLFRRREVRARLQRHGHLQGGTRRGRPLSGL